MKGKIFSEQLKEFLKISEVKNAQIANVLGYDISYISKWSSGKLLPAAKGIEQTLLVLSKTIVKSIPESSIKQVLIDYDADDTDALILKFHALLETAYVQDTAVRKGSSDFGVRVDYYNSLISQEETIYKTNEIFSESNELFALIDFTCLERKSLLSFLGIRDGTLFPDESIGTNEANVTLILYADHYGIDKQFYSFITLMHLIGVFSHKKHINIYLEDCAAGKLIIADPREGKVLSAGLLKNSSNCMPLMARYDKRDALLVQKELISIIQRCQPALRLYDSDEILEKKDYLKVIISSNPRWLVGHITELFLTVDDIANLKDRLKLGEGEYEHLYTTHQFISAVFIKNDIRILLYETAISDFVLNGEADIYNKHIHLNVQERIKVLENIYNAIGCNNICIKWISGGFFDEYRHAPNPCIFSSNTGSFIRVENNLDKNNIFSVLSPTMREIIDGCFEDMWSKHNKIVSDDSQYIKDCMSMYIDNCKALG